MNDMNALQRIDVIRHLLDQLVEARGREKAGFISVIDDFLNHIQEEILIKDEKIKDLELAQNNQNGKENSETVSPE